MTVRTSSGKGRYYATNPIAEVMYDGPLLLARMSDVSGAVVEDSSGNDRDGAYIGSPTLQAPSHPFSLGSKAVTLSGTGQYMQWAQAAWMNVAAFSIGAWVRTTASGAIRSIINRDHTTNGRAFDFRMNAAGRLEFIRITNAAGTSAIVTCTSGKFINDGSWHHVSASYDGTTIRLVIDGIADTASSAATNGILQPAAGVPLTVGATSQATATQLWQGDIADVTFFPLAIDNMRARAHSSREDDVIYTTEDMWPDDTGTINGEKPVLIYCHGAQSGAIDQNYDFTTTRVMLSYLTKYFVVAAADFGGDLFGNDWSMQKVNDLLAYARANWGGSDDPPYMIGASMGGDVCFNYALDNPVSAIAGIIPLTDVQLAFDTLGAYGLTQQISVAYPPAWSGVTHGPTNDPMQFADELDPNIPIRLFTSNDDPLLPPSTAIAFIAARGGDPALTKQQKIGPANHGAVAIGVAAPYVKAFFDDIMAGGNGGPILDTPRGANLVTAGNNGTFETNITGWTNVFGTLTRDTTEFHSGVASLKHLSGASTGFGFYANYMAHTPGDPYKLSVWVKGSGQIKFDLVNGSTVYWSSAIVTLSGVWTQYVFDYTPASGEISSFIFPKWQTQPGTLYLDDVEFYYAGNDV
jgi:concanavalin A-like lectin/glucanase superfamily protein/carbohydrate binding protein with CBM4/9 domain